MSRATPHRQPCLTSIAEELSERPRASLAYLTPWNPSNAYSSAGPRCYDSLTPSLRRWWIPTVTGAAVLFTAAHGDATWMQRADHLAFALVLGMLAWACGSIWWALAVHMTSNALWRVLPTDIGGSIICYILDLGLLTAAVIMAMVMLRGHAATRAAPSELSGKENAR